LIGRGGWICTSDWDRCDLVVPEILLLHSAYQV
jgi:hypothetical protein